MLQQVPSVSPGFRSFGRNEKRIYFRMSGSRRCGPIHMGAAGRIAVDEWEKEKGPDIGPDSWK
jgi:hypothetical protein